MLDRIYSFVTIRVVDYPSFKKNLLTQPLTFWSAYEKDFPEGANMKPLWGSIPLRTSHLIFTIIRPR